MMNLPFKLRERSGFCTPKGPTIHSAENILFTLDGSTIRFSAPRHSSSYQSREALHPRRDYKLSSETFRSFNRELVIDDSWKNLEIFYRSWGFYGPWFTGRQAELSLNIDVLTPTIPQAGVSYFHPRAFESSLANYLTFQYSKSRVDGKPRWSAPVNWAVVNNLPCAAVMLNVNPVRETHYTGIATKHLFFPIGDEYLVHFEFEPHLIASGYMEEREKQIDPAPVNQLLNDIIASLRVTLSPEAQAQQAKALEGLTDTSLTPTFPPLKWTDDGADGQNQAYQQLQNS